MENEWGIKLFDRSKSPLQLTYAGEKYLKYIIEVTEMNKKLLEEFDNIKSDCNGRITLGINTQRGAYMLPEIIPEFQKRFPKVEIKIKEGSSDYLENLILKNELDFCFLNLISYSDQFEYEHLMQEKIFLYLSHRLIIVILQLKLPHMQEVKYLVLSSMKQRKYLIM